MAFSSLAWGEISFDGLGSATLDVYNSRFIFSESQLLNPKPCLLHGVESSFSFSLGSVLLVPVAETVNLGSCFYASA